MPIKKNGINLKNVLLDVILLAVLIAFCAFLTYFYFNAHYINTGYPDWMVQAYRVAIMNQYGPISWTHTWSNGINLFQAYQFIPHLLTILVSNILHVDITRAMVLLTIVVFILIRAEIYLCLRILKFSPISSFASAILTITLTHYWQAINDYSIMFGYVAFPLVLLMWTQYLKNKLHLLFPFTIGFCFYIHPTLAFFSGLLWITTLFNSDKKILSFQTLTEVLFILLGSSVFLYPFLFKDSYVYSNTFFQSKDFLTSVLAGFPILGLSVPIYIAFVSVIVRCFMPMEKKYKWIKILTSFSAVGFVLIFTATKIQLPFFLSAFQFTRGVEYVGVGIAFAAALVFENIISNKSVLIKIILVFFVTYVMIEGLWITSIYTASPAQNLYEPVSEYIKKSGTVLDARVFSPSIGTTSYFNARSIMLPYSYAGHFDSNQVSPRLSALIVDSPPGNFFEVAPATIDRLSDYFKVTGTKYVFFDQFSAVAKALLDPNNSLNYKSVDTITLPDSVYHLFEVGWESRNAVLMDKKLGNSLNHFPFNVTFSDKSDFIDLDRYIHDFANTIYSDKNTPLAISYPTQETLQVKIPSDRSSNVVYIDESYSKDWVATFYGKREQIKSVGPNYMAVLLSDNSSGGILYLKHSWPQAMIILLFVIIATPISIGFYNSLLNITEKKERKKIIHDFN